MAANLFLMVNKRKFMARQIVRDARNVKAQVEDDPLHIGRLNFYYWFEMSFKSRNSIFKNDSEYRMIDDFYTHLKMRKYDMDNSEVPAEMLRQYNHECLRLAHIVLIHFQLAHSNNPSRVGAPF
jgi:hypothetical protein